MKQRLSPRASRYDYSSPWSYFITVCTKNRHHYFGKIISGTVYLSEIGKICEQEIEQTMIIRPWVIIDEFVVMPNHIHLLIIIDKPKRVGTHGNASVWNNKKDVLPHVPATNQSIVPITNPPMETVGSIIRQIKSRVKKYTNLHKIAFARQGRYHDHIIRDTVEYERIKRYIRQNPSNRSKDILHKQQTELDLFVG
jgi:putative transposase